MAWEHAAPFAQLSCVCKDGVQRVFEVRVDPIVDMEGEAWFYYAKPSLGEYTAQQEYFASFKRVGPNLLQLEGVKNALPGAFRGCGITRALVPHVAREHEVQIRSSRHRPAEGETRTAAATSVWQRMVRENAASYDAVEDRFYHPPRAGDA
jgi:hypothetical protein